MGTWIWANADADACLARFANDNAEDAARGGSAFAGPPLPATPNPRPRRWFSWDQEPTHWFDAKQDWLDLDARFMATHGASAFSDRWTGARNERAT